jgi:hypothetical protein
VADSSPISVPRSKYRVQVELVVTGDPRVLNTLEPFQHVDGGISIEVTHNGRTLVQAPTSDPRLGHYYVFDSGGGFDTIVLMSLTPNSRSRLRATYFAV